MTNIFTTGTLWNRLKQVTERALASGDLQPIATRFEVISDGDVRFLVRIVENLARKQRAAKTAPDFNPFLPFDPQLYIADASASHVCVLNKFNVVDHHLLIVTRTFQHQQTPLIEGDFLAMWRCLAEYPGLGFYNSGTRAGASQTHKHLQMIPLPLADAGPILPLAPFRDGVVPADRVTQNAGLPYRHAAVRFPPDLWKDQEHAARSSAALYRQLIRAIGIRVPGNVMARIAEPYNLLITREWMLAVPRRSEHFVDVSLNAMAFAGAFLVHNQEQLAALKASGPLAALRDAAGGPDWETQGQT